VTNTYLTTAIAGERPAHALHSKATKSDYGGLTDLEIAALCMAVLREPNIDVSCKEAVNRAVDANRMAS
jgi:hypothetical protein